MTKKLNTKLIVLLLAVALLFGCGVGGTLAWLVTKTEVVTNTFTIGNIKISLTEDKPTDLTAKMVPGKEIDKDPKVTVEAGSEACWLFVEVEESDNLKDFITYEVNTDSEQWTKLKEGVYYRSVAANAEANQSFDILKNNKVKVNANVTKMMMEALTENTRPTLSFTAYAVQQEGLNVEQAWEQAGIASNYPTPPASGS